MAAEAANTVWISDYCFAFQYLDGVGTTLMATALALVLGVVLFLRDAKLRRGVRERLLAENRE